MINLLELWGLVFPFGLGKAQVSRHQDSAVTKDPGQQIPSPSFIFRIHLTENLGSTLAEHPISQLCSEFSGPIGRTRDFISHSRCSIG